MSSLLSSLLSGCFLSPFPIIMTGTGTGTAVFVKQVAVRKPLVETAVPAKTGGNLVGGVAEC